ncbi:MAG: hypothetical protein ACT4TC_15620 [Myxococcaceae bacterium]
MANVIEESKSNRASCRTCRQKIEKGVLRFGEEVPNAFDPEAGPQYAWHHLLCIAKKKPRILKDAMDAHAGEIPGRAEIDAAMSEAKESLKTFPYAERASTGRSKCQACGEAIAKDELRVAFERELDRGMGPTTGAGYLHTACARGQLKDPELLSKVTANSKGLGPAEVAELEQTLIA